MSEGTYSFVYDRPSANDAFKQVGKREVTLAILATIVPEAEWEGCLVYEGTTPLEEVATVCIGTRGPGADRIQEKLIEGLEKAGVKVLQVYEGGPEVRETIARVQGQKWVSG
jgi:hypothetical protein